MVRRLRQRELPPSTPKVATVTPHTSHRQRQACSWAVPEPASMASEESSEEPWMASDPRRVHMLGRVAIWTYAGLAPRISGFKNMASQ